MNIKIRVFAASFIAILCAAALAPLLARAHAPAFPDSPGIFLVDRSDDDASLAAQVCSVAANDCSLRGAIIKANANPGSSVVLAPGQVYTLSIPSVGGNDATNGDLNVISPMTITTLCFAPPCGPAIVQGVPGWTSRILTVLNFAQAHVYHVTFRYGNGGVYIDAGSTLTLTDSTVTANNTTVNGAGIMNYGQLYLQNTRVVSNSTTSLGGGIFSGPYAYLALYSSAVLSNTADAAGGIYAWKGGLDMLDSDVTSNTVSSGGGGIFVASGALTMESSRVFSNTAGLGYGGGVIVMGVTTTADIHDSSIGWNYAGGNGGGISVGSAALTLTASTVFSNVAEYGAGIALDMTGTAYIENATISSNRAKWNGGGLYTYQAVAVTLKNATVAYNVANLGGNTGYGGGGFWNSDGSPILVLNSIVADNLDKSPFMPAPDCKGALTSSGYNLIGNTTGCVISGITTGNQLNVDPRLGPLRNNGGATWTHALSFLSTAIDTASPAICLISDQRGASRPYNGSGLEFAWCDIGAYEYRGPQRQTLFLPVIRR